MEKVNESDGVHLIVKKLGETPLQAIGRFKEVNPQYADLPVTYAGRLDPMAEGLLLLLSGSQVYDKEKYLALPKTYTVEILWGFETDTCDVLGKVQGRGSYEVESESEVDGRLRKSAGKLDQKYPAYSSKPVDGRPLFMWAREGKIREIEIPVHEVEILQSRFISRKEISKEALIEDIYRKISEVTGDFRQEEIKISWKDTMEKADTHSFTVDTIELTVSSGFYVRQFIYDFAEEKKTKAIAFNIKRVKIGDFELI